MWCLAVISVDACLTMPLLELVAVIALIDISYGTPATRLELQTKLRLWPPTRAALLNYQSIQGNESKLQYGACLVNSNNHSTIYHHDCFSAAAIPSSTCLPAPVASSVESTPQAEIDDVVNIVNSTTPLITLNPARTGSVTSDTVKLWLY